MSVSNSTVMTHRVAWVLAAVLLVVSVPASAYSYVMMQDAALVDQAEGIVQATVVDEPGMLSRTPKGPMVETSYRLSIASVLKGPRDFASATMVIPGALPSAKRGLAIYGMPRLHQGDRVLLFYVRREDGRLLPLQLLLGLFIETKVGQKAVYVRALDEEDNQKSSFNAAFSAAHDVDGFNAWTLRHVAGIYAPVDYLLAQSASPKFSQIRDSSDNAPVRWFKYDTSMTETWFALPGGETGSTTNNFTLFQQALAAWTDDVASRMLLAYGGTKASDAGFSTNDGKSAILWNDPFNNIGGSFNCATGGTLGLGGPFWNGATTNFNGTPYHNIIEGNVIIQDGAACFIDSSAGANGAELFTHEVGHAQGLGHSCGDASTPTCASSTALNDAVMRASAHGDGRGASLRADDQAAILLIYPDPAPTGLIFRNGFE
jgi:hypothetical protein